MLLDIFWFISLFISIVVAQDLRVFFDKDSSNSAEFWKCSNKVKCLSNLAVNKETRQHKIDSSFPSKILWDFSKNEECNNIIWK